MEFLERTPDGIPTRIATDARMSEAYLEVRQEASPVPDAERIVILTITRGDTTRELLLFSDEALDLASALAVCTPGVTEGT